MSIPSRIFVLVVFALGCCGWFVPTQTKAQLAKEGPKSGFVAIHGESWTQGPLTWEFELPKGAKLKKVSGTFACAPVAGWSINDGRVRQTLIWAFPSAQPVEGPPGTRITLKPNPLAAHTQIDRHLFSVNLKCPGMSGAHLWINEDWPEPIDIPGGKIFINVLNQTGKVRMPGGGAWDDDKDPFRVADSEFHTKWYWVIP